MTSSALERLFDRIYGHDQRVELRLQTQLPIAKLMENLSERLHKGPLLFCFNTEDCLIGDVSESGFDVRGYGSFVSNPRMLGKFCATSQGTTVLITIEQIEVMQLVSFMLRLAAITVAALLSIIGLVLDNYTVLFAGVGFYVITWLLFDRHLQIVNWEPQDLLQRVIRALVGASEAAEYKCYDKGGKIFQFAKPETLVERPRFFCFRAPRNFFFAGFAGLLLGLSFRLGVLMVPLSLDAPTQKFLGNAFLICSFIFIAIGSFWGVLQKKGATP